METRNHKTLPTVDEHLCTGCGLCLKVCPSQTFDLNRGKAEVTGRTCMTCGHCVAVCPVEALRIAPLEAEPDFVSFGADNRWLPHGAFDTSALVRLMRSRRSCRNYKKQPVAVGLLEDLVKIGTTAPSGTNSQKWTFTILPDRGRVTVLGHAIADYFARLNRLAANPGLRFWSKLFGNDELGRYYRKYYQTMAEGLTDWRQHGRDRLFHGAPATILIGSEPGASCPKEDALLASQNILLAAHAMGLGTCLIGFAVAAINRVPKIRRILELAEGEEMHAVIGLGYPDEQYRKAAGRKKVSPRYPQMR